MRHYYVEIYQDRSSGHRWRLRAPNGKIIADGSESYVRRDGARRAAKRMLEVVGQPQTVKLMEFD